MNPTRRNLLASSGMLVSVAALGGASPVLAEQATPPPEKKTAGGSKTDTTRDPFAQFAHQRTIKQDPSIDYIDIREYGTVTEGGDITAALQAALTAISTHKQTRIRIPRMRNKGNYTLSAASLSWPERPWIIEFDCLSVRLSTGPLAPPTGTTLRGLATQQGNFFLSRPMPRPIIQGSTSLKSLVEFVGKNNFAIENLQISGGFTALNLEACNLCTLTNLSCGTEGSGHPIILESCFWVEVYNLACQPRLASDKAAIKICTENDYTPNQLNSGLIRMSQVRVTRNGILFKAVFGPTGVDNTRIDGLMSEGQGAGTSLLTFDSSTHNIRGIEVWHPEIADPRGTCYVVKNTGSLTDSVRLKISVPQLGASGGIFWDPTTTAIKNLVLDYEVCEGSDLAPITSVYAGTQFTQHWRRDFPSSTDAKLICAPIGLPWVIGTPLAVAQDPANWVLVGGGSITTGRLAPDGSTMAGRVAGGSGATCFRANLTLAGGDWFIAGVWARDTTGSVALGHKDIKFQTVTSGFTINNSFLKLASFKEDLVVGDGWRWLCAAGKVTAIGTNPCEVIFGLANNGSSTDFFNPCAIRIPASAGVDDGWMINLARSLKGGWSSTAVAGDVSILDHQTLKVGTEKFTAKTFATLPSSPGAGMQAYITDCNTATWGATAAGGGANKVMVWYNGTNWTVMGK